MMRQAESALSLALVVDLPICVALPSLKLRRKAEAVAAAHARHDVHAAVEVHLVFRRGAKAPVFEGRGYQLGLALGVADTPLP